MNNNTTATSGLITSEHSFFQPFGLFEWRKVQMPSGIGSWPALWLLPQGSTTGEPEDDVSESYAGTVGYNSHLAGQSYHTLHYTSRGGAAAAQVLTSQMASDFTTGYHDFAIVLDRRYTAMYYDEKLVASFSNIDPLTGNSINGVGNNMYMLANVAMSTLSAGAWTPANLPQTMTIGSVYAYAPISGY